MSAAPKVGAGIHSTIKRRDVARADVAAAAAFDAEGYMARVKQAILNAGGARRVEYLSGVPIKSIYNYRNGREMSGFVLFRIAAACGVTAEWLVCGVEPAKAPQPASDDAASHTPRNEVLAAQLKVAALLLRQVADLLDQAIREC